MATVDRRLRARQLIRFRQANQPNARLITDRDYQHAQHIQPLYFHQEVNPEEDWHPEEDWPPNWDARESAYRRAQYSGSVHP